MVTLERLIQKVRPGKWAELEILDKKINAVEGPLGFPPKKRYQCLTGIHDGNTLIIEREWESLATAEAVYAKGLADPVYVQLLTDTEAFIESTQRELYVPLP